MAVDNLDSKYKNFKKVWTEIIMNDDTYFKMKKYEEQQSDESLVWFDAVDLKTCADAKTPHFYVSLHVDLKWLSYTKPTKTRYYIKTTSDSVDLLQDPNDMNFWEIWGLPQRYEKELIKALLSDVVAVYPECFMENFLKGPFEKLFNDGYLSDDQFSTDVKSKYFAKYESLLMLSEEEKELFIF